MPAQPAHWLCCGQLTVDGCEYGLLRKTADLAFSHELLRQYVSRFSSGSVDSWTAFWNHTVMKIVDPLESPAREAAELELQNVKRQFDEATQDFIQLQNIDYPAGFRCDCWKGAMASRSCLPLAICTHELFSGTCQIICGACRWSDFGWHCSWV